MLNLKKGLALVLAAATAFTFAPVANLGNAVQANAASSYLGVSVDQITLKTNETKTLTFNDPSTGSETTSDIESSDDSKVTLTSGANTDVKKLSAVAQGASVTIKGVAVGTSTVTVKVGSNSQSFVVNVIARSGAPKFTIGGQDVVGNGSVSVAKDTAAADVTVANEDAAVTSSWVVKEVSSSNSNVVKVDEADVKKVSFPAEGSSTLTITATASGFADASYNGDHKFTVAVNVVPKDSTVKVMGKDVSAALTNTDKPVGSIELTKEKNTAKVDASLTNSTDSSKEKLVYDVYTSITAAATGTTPLSKEVGKTDVYKQAVTVDKDGNITANAYAFEGHANYFIKVSNNIATASGLLKPKSAVIALVLAPTARKFTSISLGVDGQTYGATAKYDQSGVIVNGSKNAELTLSTKDKKTAAVTVTPATFTTSSTDASVADYNKTTGAIEAKKAGVTTITFEVPSDANNYGKASVVIKVTVTDKNANNPITAEDLTLTSAAPKATIKAAAQYKNTLHFALVKQDADKNWVPATDDNLTLDTKTGEVTYKNNGTRGTATVQITGDANADAEAPSAARVTVKYQPEKDASNLTVGTKAISLKAGETSTISAVATGTAISYVSYAPEIATVDANTGVVTAVKKGTAVIAVNAAETDTMKAGQELVYVTVDNGAIAAPDKVAGLKVTNAKGAKVNVSWTSQGKNIQYRVYKKVGNGKWVAKNVTKGKASLSVKKGAKVQVKVKAFVKDQDGKTVWGPKATKKTFKTDNK